MDTVAILINEVAGRKRSLNTNICIMEFDNDVRMMLNLTPNNRKKVREATANLGITRTFTDIDNALENVGRILGEV